MECDNIEVEKLIVHARGGSHVGKCINEAMQLATMENKVVLLTHNNKVYTIDPKAWGDEIWKQNSEPSDTSGGG